VVSLSIGDSADFIFADQKPSNDQTANNSIPLFFFLSLRSLFFCMSFCRLLVFSSYTTSNSLPSGFELVKLQSGDVMVFGGPARLIYHSLAKVYSNTGPRNLHLRPGRLNLTFRKH
jgi:alkylated DNA repair dioxygenase AlkB